mmetsp:Transcript_1875/g.4644  ORF Transcript_1875/g.4644 Transcript_1875/m.4644 type:complete len:241 (-) Transcript_1875:25-747(-)
MRKATTRPSSIALASRWTPTRLNVSATRWAGRGAPLPRWSRRCATASWWPACTWWRASRTEPERRSSGSAAPRATTPSTPRYGTCWWTPTSRGRGWARRWWSRLCGRCCGGTSATSRCLRTSMWWTFTAPWALWPTQTASRACFGTRAFDTGWPAGVIEMEVACFGYAICANNSNYAGAASMRVNSLVLMQRRNPVGGLRNARRAIDTGQQSLPGLRSLGVRRQLLHEEAAGHFTKTFTI